MKRDKLDRFRNVKTAVLCQEHDIPWWCTLTPRERTGKGEVHLHSYFVRQGSNRRQFRDFIRSLCK